MGRPRIGHKHGSVDVAFYQQIGVFESPFQGSLNALSVVRSQLSRMATESNERKASLILSTIYPPHISPLPVICSLTYLLRNSVYLAAHI